MTETKLPEKTGTNRRQWFGYAWAAAFVALVAETFAAVVRFLRPIQAAGFGGIVRAGRIDEFAPGSVHTVQEGRFHLVRLEDGSFLALWQRCTHLGCSVPWKAEESQFHCPCHGSLFDKRGVVVGGPAPRPLDYFPIEIKDGEILVDTGKPNQRPAFAQSQTTNV